MAIHVKPSWRKYIPHFEIYVSFPLVRVQMMAFNEEISSLRFTYLGFCWQIWKWEGRVRLFETGNRFNPPYVDTDDAQVQKCGCWISDKYKLKEYCDKHFEELQRILKKG